MQYIFACTFWSYLRKNTATMMQSIIAANYTKILIQLDFPKFLFKVLSTVNLITKQLYRSIHAGYILNVNVKFIEHLPIEQTIGNRDKVKLL